MVGICVYCKKLKLSIKKRRQSTFYENDEDNHIKCCKKCYEYIQEIWAERWEEHYREIR